MIKTAYKVQIEKKKKILTRKIKIPKRKNSWFAKRRKKNDSRIGENISTSMGQTTTTKQRF